MILINTNVNHHRFCITFGVGLLARENTKSIEWLFKTFSYVTRDYMHTYLITNQDPTMNIAIKNIFQMQYINFVCST